MLSKTVYKAKDVVIFKHHMNAQLKRDLAELWQKILRTDPKRLFGKRHTVIRDYNEDDWIAQPGYVGAQYPIGGLAFVAANPGGQKRDDIGGEDTEQYRLLKRLRSAASARRIKAFDELNRDLARSMKKWRIYERYVAALLEGLPISFSHVAFLNLVKWRTTGETLPRSLLEISWRTHTRDQLELLQPSLVISLGKSRAGPFIDEHYAAIRNITIPRTRGDLGLSDKSKAAIKSAREYLRRWTKPKN